MRIGVGIFGLITFLIVAGTVAHHGFLTASSGTGGVIAFAEYAMLAVIALAGPAYAEYLKLKDRNLAIVVAVGSALAFCVHIRHFLDAFPTIKNVEGLRPHELLLGIPAEKLAVGTHVYGALLFNFIAAAALHTFVSLDRDARQAKGAKP